MRLHPQHILEYQILFKDPTPLFLLLLYFVSPSIPFLQVVQDGPSPLDPPAYAGAQHSVMERHLVRDRHKHN